MASTTQSRKSRGRRLQQYVRDTIKSHFKLNDDDIYSRSMGASGTDVYMSDVGYTHCPLAIECKNQESLNIWSALEQSETNKTKELIPVVVFKRNRTDAYVALKFTDLLGLMGGSRD